ncbi:UDP-glucose 4-epimerase [Metschnikowia bicuspidata var. bicuspidata NRRL YB-4993]|uniref:UDP-glucose 4-epimerase n=1 Tax=Metschnikowia bicuspidata var. bicuspidata NRRL YB-4993 TaxID=869754 RepID=A0A1A0HGT5_9ASCO|nr:UDP-glucose 4-epimerase [Metschnikowia bicuspidata var. bicuspidata NRRL YB-4993]OBA23092.1 UDP-glucose 4-epimerase [Metschnikowia bicuspidata var. bicuspidata NRRL YB-4993]
MSNKDYILVTGGAGYIGSHTTVELIQNGYNVVIVDNLVNSSYDAVARIEYIVQKKVPFHNVDIGDSDALSSVFEIYRIVGVIHFAALKAVGELTQIPLDYYYNNVRGTLSLLTTMRAAGVKTIVFSSLATVYGDATRFKDMIPIPEHCPTGATNPYGRTKLMIEEMLGDIHKADPTWRSAILRYFNPIGAHPSGLIGEDPLGIPNNLLPFLAQVAVGRREKLAVFGNDYDSHDGTPIRDYIHVVDLARGHLSALEYLRNLPEKEGLYREWNLGTGKGSTVFDVYHAFCKAIGRELPYEIAGRRAGDVLNLTANPTRANLELKWKAQLSIEEACTDLWKWTTENPYGFSLENYLWKLFGDMEKYGYLSRLHTISFPDFEVSIANYGCVIQSIKKRGAQVTQGFGTLESYLQSENPFFGACIGRYANRIRGGQFEIDGKKFQVDKNEDGKNCLHGGANGFDKQFFLGPVVKQLGTNEYTMEFVHVDGSGNNGFPADLVTHVKYTIGKSSLEIEFKAEILRSSEDTATPVNLINHAYFNLSESASIDGLVAKISTNKVLEFDDQKLPTENISFIDRDLITGKTLDERAVFDHCFVVDDLDWDLDTRQKELKQIFELTSEETGRKMEVFSTEPSFQFYTGDGVKVGDHSLRCGLCIEPGRFTNAVNVPEWRKQVILKKREVYGSRMRYVFD